MKQALEAVLQAAHPVGEDSGVELTESSDGGWEASAKAVLSKGWCVTTKPVSNAFTRASWPLWDTYQKSECRSPKGLGAGLPCFGPRRL